MEKKSEKIKNLTIKKIENVFFDVREFILNELNTEIKESKNIKLKIDLKLLIMKLNNFDIKKLKLDTYNKKNTAETVPGKRITFFKKRFDNFSYDGLLLTMHHELTHYIGRDIIDFNLNEIKNLKLEFSNREMITKILNFRYFMKKNNYELNLKSINIIFNLVEKKDKSIGINERIDLSTIYKNFKYDKVILLQKLQNLVKLEQLKEEVKNT
ncbi:MAG: hypothetical protein Q9M94_04890 [Candidatus Gracilibacteria bacterium]|nr:hypothetical protein [Candidatus Gracilibacteria bacterium]MDQ7023685.1 hypothetical protein [Candidatus Gracilibacteria bacterium]